MIPIYKSEEPEALREVRLRAEERGLNPKDAYELLNRNKNRKIAVRS